jgi:hypothetical protein
MGILPSNPEVEREPEQKLGPPLVNGYDSANFRDAHTGRLTHAETSCHPADGAV